MHVPQAQLKTILGTVLYSPHREDLGLPFPLELLAFDTIGLPAAESSFSDALALRLVWLEVLRPGKCSLSLKATRTALQFGREEAACVCMHNCEVCPCMLCGKIACNWCYT